MSVFPLFPQAFGYEMSLIAGVLIGIAFGFVLERSGFGQAPELAAQFYVSDTRVLKVMFSAIVTALVGMTVLSGAGLLDLSAVTVPETFLWPQIVGGLLLGVGFIISGYCPGTSWVSAASGNKDGLLTILGVMTGSLVFGWLYPVFEPLYQSGAMGVVRLPDLLGIPQGVLAAAVVAMAVGAFLFGEWGERVLARKRGEEPPASDPRTRNRVFAGFGVAAVAGLALIAVPAGVPEAPAKAVADIEAVGLARAVVEDPSRLGIVDLRPQAECEAKRIPGALCLDGGSVEDAVAAVPAGRTLVLVGAGDVAEVPEAARAFPGEVAVLKGGMTAWADAILTPPAVPGADATPALIADYRLRSSLHSRFTGTQAAAPVVAIPRPAVRVDPGVKKGGGC